MATIWLHGFLSSPASDKARLLAEFHRQRGIPFACPELPFNIALAQQKIGRLVREFAGQPLVIGGSSLGGFFATCVAARLGLPAALVNPAVRPWRFVRANLGAHVNPYTGERVFVRESHARELERMCPASFDGKGWLVMLATGDEVLDWREADAAYPLATKILVAGGDHRVSDFADRMGPIARFCETGGRAC